MNTIFIEGIGLILIPKRNTKEDILEIVEFIMNDDILKHSIHDFLTIIKSDI